MKIEIPEKVRVIMLVTERIGVPTIVCLAFAYVYFTRLLKVIDMISDTNIQIKIISDTAKRDREEILREVRRLNYRR